MGGDGGEVGVALLRWDRSGRWVPLLRQAQDGIRQAQGRLSADAGMAGAVVWSWLGMIVDRILWAAVGSLSGRDGSAARGDMG